MERSLEQKPSPSLTAFPGKERASQPHRGRGLVTLTAFPLEETNCLVLQESASKPENLVAARHLEEANGARPPPSRWPPSPWGRAGSPQLSGLRAEIKRLQRLLSGFHRGLWGLRSRVKCGASRRARRRGGLTRRGPPCPDTCSVLGS